MTTRTETDSMGTVIVPADKYWGAQTERSLESFPFEGSRMPLAIVRALARVKKAAALANAELGLLDDEKKALIVRAADEVISGRLDAHFPLVVYQTGSGTQTNMNVNEVIANRAIELAGGVLGSKSPVHPNDDVNMGQSSNDVFPTAMHVAAVLALDDVLLPALDALRDTLAERARAFDDVVKLGRTHLMDATPVTLGQEISGWVAQLEGAARAIREARAPLLALALGGTAVGTGLNAHPDFARRAIAHLGRDTGKPFAPADNRFAALAAHDAVVGASGALRLLAVACVKIANDVRWLASGPRGGLSEITIPANEPGSSIMPGKVNPTQAEALLMVAARVLGNDVTIGFGGSQGNFELNVMKPIMAATLLESIHLLGEGCASFDARCARGIEANLPGIERNLGRSLMLVTALTPRIGYDEAAKVAKHAHAQGTTIEEAALALGVLSKADLDALLRPETMLGPRREA